MNRLDQSQQSHLRNIQKKTGKSMKELTAVVRKNRARQQSQVRTRVMRELGLSYSDANALVKATQQPAGGRKTAPKREPDALSRVYGGAKAPLRPIHEAILREANRLGEYETVPLKGHISLRRKKQFMVIGPAGTKRVEVGLNVKDLPPATRLMEQPRGSEVNYIVRLTNPEQVNAELIAWMKFAYEAAGE